MGNLWRQFRLWTAASVISGYVALALTDRFGLLLAVVGLVTTGVGFAIDRFTARRRWYRWVWDGLAICYIAFMAVDLTVLLDLVTGMVHLLVFVQCAKCLNSKGRRDYAQIYLLSFFQLLSSAALDTGIGFAIGLVVFGVTMLRALVLFDIVCAMNLLGESGPVFRCGPNVARPRGWNRRLAAVLNTFALSIMVGAVLLFCMIPRVRGGFLRRTQPAQLNMVGFSSELDLNTYGVIHNNLAVVMRVSFPDYPQGYTRGPLLWKGLSLDVYEGSRWRQIRSIGRRSYRMGVEIHDPDHSGVLTAQRVSRADLVEQEITLETSRLPLLFGLANVRMVAGPLDTVLWNYEDDSWQLTSLPAVGQLKYRAYSDVDRPSPRELRTAPTVYDDPITRAIYIDNATRWIDEGETPPRVVELALKVTAGAQTPYDKAVAVQNYLQDNYIYLLNVERASDQTPLEDFLFRTKAGHCQHLATAMAVMLRATGVPARIATGYRGGTWLESDGVYIVRENNAHVWVEVFFPGYGWVEFDPSPPNPAGYRAPGLMSRVIAALQPYQWRLQMAWARHVVGYSTQTQQGLAAGLSAGVSKWRSALEPLVEWLGLDETRLRGRWRTLAYSYMLAWLCGTILVVLLAVYFVTGRRRVLRHVALTPRTARQVAAEQRRAMFIYGKMLRLLEYRRLVKPSSATPAEFSRTVADRWPDGGPLVTTLTGIYYTLRYARPGDSRPLLADAARILKELHRLVQPNWLTRRFVL